MITLYISDNYTKKPKGKKETKSIIGTQIKKNHLSTPTIG